MNKKTNFGTAFLVVLLLLGGLFIFNQKNDPLKGVCDYFEQEMSKYLKEGMTLSRCSGRDITQINKNEYEVKGYLQDSSGERRDFNCYLEFKDGEPWDQYCEQN